MTIPFYSNWNFKILPQAAAWVLWWLIVTYLADFTNFFGLSTALITSVPLGFSVLNFWLVKRYFRASLRSPTIWVWFGLWFLVGYFLKVALEWEMKEFILAYDIPLSTRKKAYYLEQQGFFGIGLFNHLKSRLTSYFLPNAPFLLWIPAGAYFLANAVREVRAFGQLEKERMRFEIGVLKSQINPKFINESLENLKTLTVADPDRAAETVLKLANATRYTLYETDAEYVPLQKELDFIINCIDLEEMRLADRANVNFRLKTNQSAHLQIAPMLLFPLIERAFQCVQSSCEIDLLVEKSTLTLKIEADKQANCQSETIESVKKRLAYFYANKHKLQLIENERIFKVELLIEL